MENRSVSQEVVAYSTVPHNQYPKIKHAPELIKYGRHVEIEYYASLPFRGRISDGPTTGSATK